ncbi:hypothetical protein BC6307_15300 [Sutcliffiella cohnii]|uniref:Adhesin n=1 Tax=Sutcliffiella cohnii TaxID=33932 RepID=A0A223KSW0_9BACI|nr:hypothetical protein [Sutcliffiella cohnii]AST92560.1 hypothetical protein BC6307_15300 [Sutcliffiella cohnii]
MNISNEAKIALENILEEHEANNVRLFHNSTCGDTPVGISLDNPKKDDIVVTINEINIAMEPEVESLLKGVTLKVEEGPYGEALVFEGLELNCCCD